MTRSAWILVFVLALGAGVMGLSLLDEPPGLGGRPHPELSTMRQGGDGQARHAPILLPGWLLGCGIICCFSAVVHFGALRGHGRRRLSLLLKVATFLYLAAWSWLVWAYHLSLGASEPNLILTLPPPTAIMIFVFWPVSMLFNACFVLGFNRWVLTSEEEAAFRRLVDRQNRSEDG